MVIVETSWQEFLSPDSEIPHDIHFLAKGADKGDDSSNKPIGAHKVLLAGVSPVFRRMLFGPLKEEREVIEVQDTTHEAFTTMIDFIYKPPGSQFFPAPYEDGDKEVTEIHCPQKFFDLLDLAEKYEIVSLKVALTSNVLETLDITADKVIVAATVAMKYKIPFNEISTRMLARCLEFLLQWKRSKAGVDLWTQFWALVNNSEQESLKEKLAGTPFVNIRHNLRHVFFKAMLYMQGGLASYDNCLYLASSGVDVR